jgi:hypothetical protein
MEKEVERLAVLETKVNTLQTGQDRIEKKLDTLGTKIDDGFLKKADFDIFKKEFESKNASQDKDIDGIKNSKVMKTWIGFMALIISMLLNLFALFEIVIRK